MTGQSLYISTKESQPEALSSVRSFFLLLTFLAASTMPAMAFAEVSPEQETNPPDAAQEDTSGHSNLDQDIDTTDEASLNAEGDNTRSGDTRKNGGVGNSGLWIFVDPDTGELTSQPTPQQLEQVRSFQGSLNKSSDGLVPFALDGGGRGVHLANRFRHALRVSLQDDGSFALTCSDHPDDQVRLASPAHEPAPVQ